MPDPTAPAPLRETLYYEVANRLRPVFSELSDQVFADVVARIVEARLEMRQASERTSAQSTRRERYRPASTPPADPGLREPRP